MELALEFTFEAMLGEPLIPGGGVMYEVHRAT